MTAWRKLTEEELNRCPWCQQDRRHGQHGEQEHHAEGVIIRCSFQTLTRMPAYSTRIIGIPKEQI